jgi:SAM-dependent methyltransferase
MSRVPPVTASTQVPYPPLPLANRVCSLDGRGEPFGAYEALGAEAREALVGLLPNDWTFTGKRVLDFGCGAGRTLRHFLPEAEKGAELWGVDIDAPSVAWLDENLCPPLQVRRGAPDPPLDFESGSFELIWALSVFTHLTDSSLPWLLELHRLLKPGGLLIATFMGRWNSGFFVEEPWDEDRVGMTALMHDNPWDSGGPVVLMSEWWVRAHWGRAFEIVEIAPQVHGQSWALLRPREVELSVADLERPADDKREALALRQTLGLTERDHAEQIDSIRRTYEESRSWRVTHPMRVAARRLRALRSR